MIYYKKGITSEGLDKRVLDLLSVFTIDITITSAKRNGNKGSSHDKGLAIDIRTSNSTSRFIVLQELFRLHLNRIGIYDKHIHIDLDPDKDPEVAWHGISK